MSDLIWMMAIQTLVQIATLIILAVWFVLWLAI